MKVDHVPSCVSLFVGMFDHFVGMQDETELCLKWRTFDLNRRRLCQCVGTCMKYAYQQLCTATSNLETSYWMMSSILMSLTVELQISPHLVQTTRYISVSKTETCVKDYLHNCVKVGWFV
jgi:hypothetical protein